MLWWEFGGDSILSFMINHLINFKLSNEGNKLRPKPLFKISGFFPDIEVLRRVIIRGLLSRKNVSGIFRSMVDTVLSWQYSFPISSRIPLKINDQNGQSFKSQFCTKASLWPQALYKWFKCVPLQRDIVEQHSVEVWALNIDSPWYLTSFFRSKDRY
jgi:hypothetical protein